MAALITHLVLHGMMIVLRDMFQVGGHFGGGQEESAIATTESARASMVPLTTIALTAG